MKRSTPMEIDEARWISLHPREGETLRAALERTLRDKMLAGSLRSGVQLPASRALARQLAVSRGVVSDAYAQLASQGFLVLRARTAPVVAEIRRRQAPIAAAPAKARQPRYDLTPTTPDVTLFPVRRWLAAFERATRRLTSMSLDYGDHQGERVLRDALADHLGRTRGVVADPEQILVVQGTAQGVDLLLRVLAGRGATRIAVEDPSHTTLHERIRALGFTLVAQPVDEEGMVVRDLDADAVVVTPAHQFPTGSVLSGERRRALLAWAQERNALIIEDDYDAEFRYDRDPVRALQGLAPENVAQLGTVSKTLAPALRLGWIVVPPPLAAAAAGVKRLLDDFSPTLDQLALAELLTHGDYDRHVRRARLIYRARRDRMLAALSRQLPQLAVEGVAAGMHLLLRLPDELDDVALSDDAAQVGVRVPALTSFRVERSPSQGLVIGYGRLHESAVAPAIRALAGIVRQRLP